MKEHLEKQTVKNLHIYLHPFTEVYSTVEGITLDEEPLLPTPPALYYSVIENLDQTIPEEEVTMMNNMIDSFVQVNGYFNWGKFNEEELVLYNRGSLKIEGIQLAPSVVEKAKSYMKKRGI